MARVVLVEAQPWDPITGAPVAVRLAGGGRRHYLHKGYTDWLGGIVELPKISTALEFGQDGFTGGSIPRAAAIGFSPTRAGAGARLAGLLWAGAPIIVSVGDDETAAIQWSITIAGTVAGYSTNRGTFAFTLSELAGQLAKPILAGATFAGTGGLEGDAAATGRAKRRSWGPSW